MLRNALHITNWFLLGLIFIPISVAAQNEYLATVLQPDTAEVKAVCFPTVDVEDIYTTGSELMIFPNPFSEKTTIIIPCSDKGQQTLSVFDITGKKVVTKTFKGNRFTLFKDELSEGMYYIEIKGIRSYIGKILITR